MVITLRSTDFQTIVSGRAVTVDYTHRLDTGAQEIKVNGDIVVQRANFIGGKEKFRIFGVMSELNIQILADGQFEYTLTVDRKVMGRNRDPIYRWEATVNGLHCNISLDMRLMEILVNEESVEFDSHFDDYGETITPFEINRVPCRIETYKDDNKKGIAFHLIVGGEKITPLR